jgi:monoamine oxidase
VAFAALGQMCKAVPLDAPWNAKKAVKWDRITVAHWLGGYVRSRAAHDLLETAIANTYTSAASRYRCCLRCTRWR